MNQTSNAQMQAGGVNLLIFPGGGSPKVPPYPDIYSLLVREAKQRGYREVSVLSWPGHTDSREDNDSELTFEGAVSVATEHILEQERRGQQYHIIGRSLGTLIAVASVKATEAPGCRRLILWGPPPFWLLWQKFKQGYDEFRSLSLTKGLRISDNFFAGVIPFESLLQEVRLDTIVATGEDDPHSPPAFLDYLEMICKSRRNVRFKTVPGKHEMTEKDSNWREYIDALFEKSYATGQDDLVGGNEAG